MAPNVVELARRIALTSQPRQALTAIAELRGHLETLEAYYVGAAIAGGASWAEVGAALGVSKQAVHKRYRRREAQGPEAGSRSITITGRARQAVYLARREAAAAGRRSVAPEHLLVGLLRVPDGVAARELARQGISVEMARAAAGVQGGGSRLDPTAVSISARARIVLERALDEAVALGDGELGDLHVLLALLAHGGPAARRAFAHVGLDAAAARAALLASRQEGNVRLAP